MTTNYPRCATCRWWDKDEMDPEVQPLFGPSIDGGQCEMASSVYLVDGGAAAGGDYGGGGWLYTSPTFGCVLHEERDDD